MNVRENHSNDVSEPPSPQPTLQRTQSRDQQLLSATARQPNGRPLARIGAYGDGGGGGSSSTLVPVATTAASAPRYVTENYNGHRPRMA
jgi:hypothetical protein